MWWPEPTRALAAGLLALALSPVLAGCGFQPLYGRGTGAVTTAELDTVQLPFLPERAGQLVRSYLIRSFNPDGRRGETQYTLGIKLSKSSASLGTRKDGTATRVDITLSAALSLREIAGDRQVFHGTSIATASYNVLEERFANVAGEQDAIRRAAESLAQNITTRVAVFLKSRKKEG